MFKGFWSTQRKKVLLTYDPCSSNYLSFLSVYRLQSGCFCHVDSKKTLGNKFLLITFTSYSYLVLKSNSDLIYWRLPRLKLYFKLTFRETHNASSSHQLCRKTQKHQRAHKMYESNLINANSQIGFQKLICLRKWIKDRNKEGGHRELSRQRNNKQRRCRGEKVEEKEVSGQGGGHGALWMGRFDNVRDGWEEKTKIEVNSEQTRKLSCISSKYQFSVFVFDAASLQNVSRFARSIIFVY